MTAIEQIRAELDAATPGPWADHLTDLPGRVEILIRSTDADVAVIVTDDLNGNPVQDATLIAHAPTYLAALLDVAEAAQRMVTSASAHFRCPLCDKNGHGHISACPVLALRTALDLLPQVHPKEGE